MRALANARTAMEVFHGRRIAVTDGAGFLARAAVRKLQGRGCTDVTVPRRARCDLSRRDHIEGLFDKHRPHLLQHLATTVDSPAADKFEPKTSYVIASLLGKFEPAVETGVTEIGIGGRECATRDFIRVEDGAAHEESCNRKKTACAQGF